MRTIFKISAILIVLISILSTAFYFIYWTKTPTYSLKMLEESVQTNNIKTFEKYFDLNVICEKSFDDILAIKKKNRTISILAYLFNPIDKIKAIGSLKTRTINFIKGQSGGHTITDSKDFSIKKVEIENKTDKMVLATIEFKDSPQGKIPTTIVKMVKLDNGIWQVKEIINWEDILSTLGEDQYWLFPEFPKHNPKIT